MKKKLTVTITALCLMGLIAWFSTRENIGYIYVQGDEITLFIEEEKSYQTYPYNDELSTFDNPIIVFSSVKASKEMFQYAAIDFNTMSVEENEKEYALAHFLGQTYIKNEGQEYYLYTLMTFDGIRISVHSQSRDVDKLKSLTIGDVIVVEYDYMRWLAPDIEIRGELDQVTGMYEVCIFCNEETTYHTIKMTDIKGVFANQSVITAAEQEYVLVANSQLGYSYYIKLATIELIQEGIIGVTRDMLMVLYNDELITVDELLDSIDRYYSVEDDIIVTDIQWLQTIGVELDNLSY